MSDALLRSLDLFFDEESLSNSGKEGYERYISEAPFPHAVIDNFLPEMIANQLEQDISRVDGVPDTAVDIPQERLKSAYAPEKAPPESQAIFYYFNSRPFIRFLEELTGIKGLIPDPDFLGGGFHTIANGGHLNVHADFNFHPRMKLERRINALLYLNRDWENAYGGALELWDSDMTECKKSVTPIFNRLVVFNTTSSSYHGNPEPVNHPAGVMRRSVALYYYTATWSADKATHTTKFGVRPNTDDRGFSGRRRTREVVEDFLPPIVLRLARRVVKATKTRGRT